MHARISKNPQAAARWVEAAALNGIVSAQIAWGQMLVDGHGVARDPEAGRRWFDVAAAAGSAEGRNMVGRAFELGWGVAADPARAAGHYRQAAEAGHGWGQFNLATLLLEGRGVPLSRTEALHWYVRAARRGGGEAAAKSATMVGRYLEHGWDRPSRPAAAARWYLRGAEGGDYRGQFDLARLLLERTGRLDLAAPWFTRAVEAGVPAFCRHVGMALRGSPEPTLRQIALRALERAAESGEPEDLRAYGGALAEGLGAIPDAAAAAQFFRRAREAENEARRLAAKGASAVAASSSPASRKRPTALLRAARHALTAAHRARRSITNR
ncbi:tetratricopeptide repeat protein [Ancylobacter sp.]|uniref:tetratricopeptide repeat protein n=1 Tax=Ancylobacter sp. TaxID=1872567 RepID=UPI003D11ABC3